MRARDSRSNVSSDIERVIGGPGPDVIVASETKHLSPEVDRNYFEGGDEVDFLDGRFGDDTIDPGAGDGDGAVGGPGTDTITYADRSSPVSVSLDESANDGSDTNGDGTAEEGDNAQGMEIAIGGRSGDILSGNDTDDSLDGRGGDDQLDGKRGADFLVGGRAAMTSSRTPGEALQWQCGWTCPSPPKSRTAGRIWTATAAGRNTTSFGCRGRGWWSGNDLLIGTPGSNRLDGADGADDVRGEAGVDVLMGGTGVDSLRGGSGRTITKVVLAQTWPTTRRGPHASRWTSTAMPTTVKRARTTHSQKSRGARRRRQRQPDRGRGQQPPLRRGRRRFDSGARRR